MNFIAKLVSGDLDPSVHLQFQKFSKGEFRDRAVVKAKKAANGKYTIATSAEFANDLVRRGAEKLGATKVPVTGAIVSTVNLKELPQFSDILAHAEVKQFQGVKRFLLKSDFSGEDILAMIAASPKAFFALSFKGEDFEIKIKPKAPKSGKPGKESEDGPKADFCRLMTPDSSWAQSFVPGHPHFKEATLNHTYFIEHIVVPDDMKGEKDFAKVREAALRKGKIVQKCTVDGNEEMKDIPFQA